MEPRRLKNFIGGKWQDSHSNIYENVYNPATEEILCQIPISNRQDLEQACEIAQKSFEKWHKVPVPQRARILFKLQHLLQANKEELAKLITLENGKNLSEALGEVGRAIENIEFAAGAPTLMMGDSLSNIATAVEASSYRYPLGVCAGITPFNFPIMVPCWTFPMAIALGNTFILKPSEKTPLLVERLVDLCTEAGLPAGVLNVVYGSHEVVNGILENPLIKAISFVGSKSVGEYVYQKGSYHLKRVQALTGAKNHTIVLKDAPLHFTIKGIISSAFGSAGERCMACSVVAVEEDIYDSFMRELKKQAESIPMGNGLEEGIFLGPMIREENKEKTFSYIEKGIEEGAQLVVDGRKRTCERGYFIGPTIFEEVKTNMTIWKEEVFAPFLSVIKVKNLREAIDLANRSEFANGACLFTNNANAIRYFRENIDAGMLGINLSVPAPMAFFPFSGWKSSFYGTLHANGKDSIDFYTRRKVVTACYPETEFNSD